MSKLEIIQSLLLTQPQKIVIVPDKKHIKIGEFDRLNKNNSDSKPEFKKNDKRDDTGFDKYLEEEISKYR